VTCEKPFLLLAARAENFLGLLPADLSCRSLDLDLDALTKPTRRPRRLLDLLAGEYDVVLLDCPPSVSPTLSAIEQMADGLDVDTEAPGEPWRWLRANAAKQASIMRRNRHVTSGTTRFDHASSELWTQRPIILRGPGSSSHGARSGPRSTKLCRDARPSMTPRASWTRPLPW